MGAPSARRTSRAGTITWVIPCRDCGDKLSGQEKKDAKAAWKRHDRIVHEPQRRAAKATAKASAKREKTLKAKQARALAAAERKASIAADRQAGREANHKAKAADDGRGWRSTRPTPGLHTKGIPGVPDGQNVNGKVYYSPDENGRQKPVPHTVLRRHVQGWDD